MKNLTLIHLALCASAFTTGSAFSEQWLKLTETDNSIYFLDKDSINKIGDYFSINIKRNGKIDQLKTSSAMNYHIDCEKNTYSLQESRTYSDIDFKGEEVIGKLPVLGEHKIAKINTVGETYIRAACEKTPLNDGADSTKLSKSQESYFKNKELEKNSIQSLLVTLKSATDENGACRLDFVIHNRLGFDLTSNSLVGSIISIKGKQYNLVDSNIGLMPRSVAEFNNGLKNGQEITTSSKINGLKCEEIKTIGRFGISNETAAINNGLIKLTLISPRTEVSGIGFSWDPDSYGARYRESEAIKARMYEVKQTMKYSIAFICIDPYGGTNNDIAIAKTLLGLLRQEQFQAYAGTINSSQVSKFCTDAGNRPLTNLESFKKNYNENIGTNAGRDYVWSRPDRNTTWGIIGR